MNENEYENESGDDEQSQQTMAASYANVVQTYLSRNSKPPDVQDPNEDEKSKKELHDRLIHTSSKPIVPLHIISNTASFRKQHASGTPYQTVWSYQVSLWISSKL